MNAPPISDPLRPRDDGRNTAPPATATPLDPALQREAAHEQHFQENLAKQRSEFITLSAGLRNQTADAPEAEADRSRLADLYKRLIPAVHCVDVDDGFHDWIEGLEHLPQPHRRGLVLVGGWYSPQDMEPENLLVPPPELLAVLSQHAVYRQAKKLRDQMEGMSYTGPAFPEVRHEFWDWINQHAEHFQAAAVEGKWQFDNVGWVCEARLGSLLNDVEWHLLLLNRKGLLFHPTTQDPEQGWRDFRQFVELYRHLPDEFRQRFGPCLVAFQPAPPPAAKASPTTTLTPPATKK